MRVKKGAKSGRSPMHQCRSGRNDESDSTNEFPSGFEPNSGVELLSPKQRNEAEFSRTQIVQSEPKVMPESSIHTQVEETDVEAQGKAMNDDGKRR